MNPSPSIGRIFSRDCLLAMTLCATVLAPSLAVLCERSQAAENPATRQAGNPQATPAPPPRITVSHETTRILRPLRGDGYVDYVAALNQMASQGVTPKNNAAVLFVQCARLRRLQTGRSDAHRQAAANRTESARGPAPRGLQ